MAVHGAQASSSARRSAGRGDASRLITDLLAPPVQLDMLRLRLVAIGGRVRELATGVRLHLASSHPGQPLWDLLASRPERL